MTLLKAQFTDADFLDGILRENTDGNYEINFKVKVKDSAATLNDILVPIPFSQKPDLNLV